MDNKTKDAIKQLQAEIKQLHALVAAKPSAGSSEPTPDVPEDNVPGRKSRAFAVQCIIAHSASGNGADMKKMTVAATAVQIAQTTDDAAASLGCAVSSPQKVGLLRALLDKESESAAALGDATHLSTGSLYHHLRELMRTDLVRQSGRNQYHLTERGIRTLLVVLALAAT